METLGLLAGIGHLPVDVAQSAKKLGYKVVAIAVVPETDPELPENADVCRKTQMCFIPSMWARWEKSSGH